MPSRKRRLSWGGRALRPCSGGSSTPMIAHSLFEGLPCAKAALQRAALKKRSARLRRRYVSRI